MYRWITRLVPFVALVAVVQAQGPIPPGGGSDVGQIPCHPCLATGTCSPVDPLASGADHTCQNHAKHEHRRLTIAGSDFTMASFAKADLRGSAFYGCTFDRASLYSADLSFGKLIASHGEEMLLLDARATNADFSKSSLRRGYFAGADFSGSILVAEFCHSNLQGANFTGAVLSSGLEMADFCNADLSGAIGLYDTVGMARYSPCTDFSDTGFDPVLAGWVLATGAEIGERYCSPALPNSTGNSAFLTVWGCPDVDRNSFEVCATGLPMGQFGIFLASQSEGFVPNFGGSSGNLCLGGEICCYAGMVQNTGMGGELRVTLDLDALPPPFRGGIHSGETWYYQAWYRDIEYRYINPLRTTNFSDAVAVMFK